MSGDTDLWAEVSRLGHGDLLWLIAYLSAGDPRGVRAGLAAMRAARAEAADADGDS